MLILMGMRHLRLVTLILILTIAGLAIISIIRASGVPAIHGKVIGVDAGHGGRDPGATDGRTYVEKEINLEFALMLRDELTAAGARPVMTRETDTDFVGNRRFSSAREEKRYDLGKRIELVQSAGAEILISMHANIHPTDESARGPIIFFCPGSTEGERLAGCIQEQLNILIDPRYQHNPCSLPFYIIRASEIPAVIVEVGFLSNPDERRQMKKLIYRKLFVKAIVRGIEAYFTEKRH